MVLIDSSCWVHFFRRRGDATIRGRVAKLLETGQAAWCPLVRLELWNGVGSESDRKILREHERWLPDLAITDEVWARACVLAGRCRAAGKTVPANDVLIVACARHHEAELEHADAHFDLLLKL
jgi:predicted nucleic acid-binding protein